MLWPQIPNGAVVVDASNIPQHGIGNCFGLCIARPLDFRFQDRTVVTNSGQQASSRRERTALPVSFGSPESDSGECRLSMM